MGRTQLKLKRFIDEHILKGYINFRRLSNGFFEILTPRKNKKLNPAFEELFKAYEIYNGRTYKSYECKDTFKTAIRRSRLYEVIKSSEGKFVFREKTEVCQETLSTERYNTLDEENKENMMAAGSNSSGFENEKCSSSVPSPDPIKMFDKHTQYISPSSNEYIVDDIEMEEIPENSKKDKKENTCNSGEYSCWVPNPATMFDRHTQYVASSSSSKCMDSDIEMEEIPG